MIGGMKLQTRILRVLFAVALLGCIELSAAQKRTEMIPMRDGTRLVTDIHLPFGKPPFPVVLARSVYGRGVDPKGFVSRRYAFVIQSVRGRDGSEGRDDCMQADGWREGLRDGEDTVNWLIAQPWCNGKIATWGGSALGITQTLMAPSSDKITCQHIDVAACSFYGQLSYQGGVFRKCMCEKWLTMQKLPHVIDMWKSHPTYDEYWLYYNAEARAGEITAPALHVGGWHDIFAEGTIRSFRSRQHNGGPGAKGNQKLIMKWSSHGPDVSPDYKFKQNRFDVKVSREQEKFFDYWCKGVRNGIMDKPAVTYYVLGDDSDTSAPGNEWRTAGDWPPFATEPTSFFLNPDGSLTPSRPMCAMGAMGFCYDPGDPFPTLGGANLTIPAGPFDQRKAAVGRSDYLEFLSRPLRDPLEVTGEVSVRFFVSTDCPDTDITAKVMDVYPPGDGRRILMMDSILRLRFRDGFEKESPPPESAGQVMEVRFDLGPISWILNRGHRIGLHVSSSNYPRFEKNPNNGLHFPSDATPSRIARNFLRMGDAHPSALILPLRPDDAAKQK